MWKGNKVMTVKELFEFAKKYNLEDAELYFNAGYYCKVNHAILDVSRDFPEQNKIILSE